MRLMMSENRPKETSKNADRYWQMWGIPLFGGGEAEVLEIIKGWFNQPSSQSFSEPRWIATVNPEFMMAAEEDADFRGILNKTNLNVVDGVGLIWAREVTGGKSAFEAGVEILHGKHRENLITGADLMDKMCGLAEKEGKTVYFYGGWEDRSERTAKYFLRKYPKLKVAGYRAEDFDFKTETDILFVARAMKKQEKWIAANFDKLKVKVVMGVGRSFDYYSGELPRAPKKLRKMGLEWLYSLYREPKRWRRQLALPRFIWKVLMD
jgi:N-acetylglucosaminyldiphosphoundecaprenol N-acetyl-beta-D-mannosaminyltransferase